MTGKTNQHDKHAGPPIEIPHVYGDDTPSDCSDDADMEQDGGAGGNAQGSEDAEIGVLTWNVKLNGD